MHAWTRTARLGLAALALSAAAAVPVPVSARAHAPASQDTSCRTCRERGRLDCREHKKSERGLEGTSVWCSWVDDCEACGGVGWMDCPDCEDAAVAAELEHRRERRAESHARSREIAEVMERPVLVAESEHFRLVWEVGDWKVGTKRRTAHQALHLYLDRFEAIHARYCELLGVDPSDFERPNEVFAWSERADQVTASRELLMSESAYPTNRLGLESRHSVWVDKRFFAGDDELHRALVHNVAHLLLNAQRPPQMLSAVDAGWIDVGFAHWMEFELTGQADTFCYAAGPREDPLSRKDWRRIVGDLERRDALTDPESFFVRRGAELSRLEHAQAFGWVDWFVRTDPARFELLARRLRTRLPMRDAARELHACDLKELQVQWREWIRAEYPSR